MQDRPTERVRVLLDGLTASAIVDRVHPYYSGYQFEGEWLDTLKESIEGELDDLDRIIRGRAGTPPCPSMPTGYPSTSGTCL